MSIVQVGPFPISLDCIRGGIEASVYGIANELAKLYDVHVIDFPRLNVKDAIERVNNITIYRYCNYGKYNKDAEKRVEEIITQINTLSPDIVHIHGTVKFSYLLFQRLHKNGVKTILTVHGLFYVEKKNILQRNFSLKNLYQYIAQSYYEFKLLNLAESVIVDTEYVAEHVRKCRDQGKIKRIPNLYVIPQGINDNYFNLNNSPSSNTILSVGAIAKRKGHLFLLQAFDQLCEKISDVQLIIAGVVAEWSYYSELKTYIQQSPNKNRIQLKINISQEEIFELYEQTKLFALHSQEESQGIVFAEAMATGSPIVATKVGGIPYVVNDGKSGLLSPFGDVEAFCSHLYEIYTNHKEYSKMAHYAKNAAKVYSWSNIQEEILKLYKMI